MVVLAIHIVLSLDSQSSLPYFGCLYFLYLLNFVFVAPKLKGRPRKKRKLLDISPDSSDSESSSESSSSSSTKVSYLNLF